MNPQMLIYIKKYFRLKQKLISTFFILLALGLSYYATVIRENNVAEYTTTQCVYNEYFVVDLSQAIDINEVQWQLPHLIKIGITSIVVSLIVIGIMGILYNLLAKGCFEGALAPLQLSEEELHKLFIQVNKDRNDPNLKDLLKKDDIIFGVILVFSIFLIIGVQIDSYGKVLTKNFEYVKAMAQEDKYQAVGVTISKDEEGTYYVYVANKNNVIDLARVQGMITYPKQALICNRGFTLTAEDENTLTYTRHIVE